jgi:hypothetical protein
VLQRRDGPHAGAGERVERVAELVDHQSLAVEPRPRRPGTEGPHDFHGEWNYTINAQTVSA